MSRAQSPRHARAAQPEISGALVALLLAAFALTAFGILMIYSASAVSAAANDGSAFYYVIRQLAAAIIGAGIVFVGFKLDYHILCDRLAIPLWVLAVLLIGATLIVSSAVKGATRWLDLGFISVQPSEFAKPVIIIVAATILRRYFEEGSIDGPRTAMHFAAGVIGPIALILLQPDKGTSIILAVTVLAMLYLAGLPVRYMAGLGAAAVAVALFLTLRDDYSRQRVLTMFDPWRDPYDTGYQLIQGFYAFARGGVLGAGIGMSRQKYSYLPEAHNDFIFAIVGEELGLVGAIGVILCFAIIAWAGFRICRDAPDLSGKLIAGGCTTLIIVQAFVNVMGVMGVMPMTGKPLPFLSYGGSSILSTLMLLALLASVATHSQAREATSHRMLGLVDDDDYDYAPAPSMTLVSGGMGRGASGGSGYRPKRIDLGPSAADRLRSRGGRS